jgi:hypothetical protein
MKNDKLTSDSTNRLPDYFNPHNVEQLPNMNSYPLIKEEPPAPDPQELLKKKYPVKIIAGVAFLVLSLLTIPVAVYITQKPTEVFIEATATPTPTPTPSFTSKVN